MPESRDGLNTAWVAESTLLLLGGWVNLTGLGYAFVLFQALVVAGFAEAQYLGLRRSSAPALVGAA